MAQTRIAAVERGDPEVGLDVLFLAFFAIGGTRADLATIMAGLDELARR